MLLALEGVLAMTFLDTRYRLTRSLTSEELERLRAAIEAATPDEANEV